MNIKQDVSKPLDEVLTRQDVNAQYMAGDLEIPPSKLSKDRTGFGKSDPNTTAKYAQYLHDQRFNTAMAAKFYSTLAEFSTSQWAEKFQDSPFATWNEQLWTEDDRRKLGVPAHKIMLKPKDKWTNEERSIVMNWLIKLLQTIQITTTTAIQTAEVAEIDLPELIQSINKGSVNDD